MKSAKTTTRRRATTQPSGETLETRALLTGGAGNTFALVTGAVGTAGQSTKETFVLDAAHFTFPRRSVLLGIDIAPGSNSQVKPLIAAVEDGQGKREIGTIRSVYGEQVGSDAVGKLASAALVNLSTKVGKDGKPVDTPYMVEVEGENSTTGSFLLGFYLPGDVDGDGNVTQTDMKAIRSAKGAALGSNTYNFNADSNRDGVITNVDLSLAQKNLGVRTTIQPIVLANLDPASDSGVTNRTTVYQKVIFNGTATPGAKVRYTEINGRTPEYTATVAADGTYSLVATLAEGDNTYRVTSTDAFGQEISGQIEAVKYEKPAVPVESPTVPKDPPKAIVTVQTTTPRNRPGGRLAQGATATDPNSVTPNDQAARLRERLASQKKSS